jgi:2-succinyl-6-hydroxy-2,4-cyclohexadiene-1-carboxylate synthase
VAASVTGIAAYLGVMRLHAEHRGHGPRLVLVHGFTQTGRSWCHVTPALAETFDVITVDCPGHGRSSAITAGLVDGAALLGAAGGRATYLGYSMGGRLTLHLALAQPALVERLVLLGATAGIDDPAERAARRAADDALAASIERDGVDAFLERWLAQPLFRGLPHDEADRADRARNTVAGLAASLRRAGTGVQEKLWDSLGQLSMPVLVVAGAHDEKFTALGQRLAAAIGPNAQLALVPGAGHAAHLERPDAFLATVQPWLSATAGSRPDGQES